MKRFPFLDRAAEKIAGTDAAVTTLSTRGYIGRDERIRTRPTPISNVSWNSPQPRQLTQDPPGINTNKFEISRSRVGDIQRKPTFAARGMPWIPKTFEDARTPQHSFR